MKVSDLGCWWKPRNWRPDKIMLLRWSRKEKNSKGMPIERR